MVAGFLAGSIPFGLFIGLAKGVDIRTLGSKNIGATNVGRVLGRKYFLLCFGLDVLKGLVPTLVMGAVLGRLGEVFMPARDAAWWLAGMAAPVLGHVFSPWLKFKGGKGVATGLGALLGVVPALAAPGACAFLLWLIVLAAKRYISLASIVAGLSLPLWVVVLFLVAPWERGGAPLPRLEAAAPFAGLALGLALLVVWTHRANIARLRAGTEMKVGQRIAVANRMVPGSEP